MLRSCVRSVLALVPVQRWHKHPPRSPSDLCTWELATRPSKSSHRGSPSRSSNSSSSSRGCLSPPTSTSTSTTVTVNADSRCRVEAPMLGLRAPRGRAVGSAQHRRGQLREIPGPTSSRRAVFGFREFRVRLWTRVYGLLAKMASARVEV